MVKLRRNEQRCCRELPIWTGDEFETPAFMKPVSRESAIPLITLFLKQDHQEYLNGSRLRMVKYEDLICPVTSLMERQELNLNLDIFLYIPTVRGRLNVQVGAIVLNFIKITTNWGAGEIFFTEKKMPTFRNGF